MRHWLLRSMFIGLVVGLATVGGLFTETLFNSNRHTPSLTAGGLSMPVESVLTTTQVPHKHLGAVLSRYTTKYDAKERGTVADLQLIADQLQGTRIAPNATFSFLAQVRKFATPINQHDRVVHIYGRISKNTSWSACQLASTLFNAALLADLPMLAHVNQTRPVGYVPLGFDVAVASVEPDLRFKNNLSLPIEIDVQILPKIIQVTLYGHRDSASHVALQFKINESVPPKTIYQTDSSLPTGQSRTLTKGLEGYLVSARRIVTNSVGKNIGIDRWSAYYEPQDQIILVGSGTNGK